jgi:predicted ATPase
MQTRRRINIAVAGGPGTGKSTLAAALFSAPKEKGYDYDLVPEESRPLKKEFGACRSPFDRFYLWRQQERQELRSIATDGFVTDWPLFHYYVAAKLYSTEPRDELAVRELLRMCLEPALKDRYQLIVIAADADEIPYKKDANRRAGRVVARKKHALTMSYLQHFLPERLLLVRGVVKARVRTVLKRLDEIRHARPSR